MVMLANLACKGLCSKSRLPAPLLPLEKREPLGDLDLLLHLAARCTICA
jgi:hypothetical protein